MAFFYERKQILPRSNLSRDEISRSDFKKQVLPDFFTDKYSFFKDNKKVLWE
jgi:hypothetical protein